MEIKTDIVASKNINETWESVSSLCNGNYFYCTTDDNFPDVEMIPQEWYQYQLSGRIEFRKRKHPTLGYEKGWFVEPVHFYDCDEKRYPGFNMSDVDVMKLWLEVIQTGGVVTDGIVDLFGEMKG